MLVLLRHGETRADEEKKFGGQNPGRLTKAGTDLAVQYSDALSGLHFDWCFAARSMAAVDTLARVVRFKPKLNIDSSALNEPSAGDYEMMSFAALKKKLPPRQYRLWDRDYFVGPPNGESMADASERAFSWFLKDVETPFKANPTEHYLIVVGPIMMKLLLGRLQKLEESEVIKLEPYAHPYSFDRIP
jgi:broad specificity phosphatase PhoE